MGVVEAIRRPCPTLTPNPETGATHARKRLPGRFKARPLGNFTPSPPPPSLSDDGEHSPRGSGALARHDEGTSRCGPCVQDRSNANGDCRAFSHRKCPPWWTLAAIVDHALRTDQTRQRNSACDALRACGLSVPLAEAGGVEREGPVQGGADALPLAARPARGARGRTSSRAVERSWQAPSQSRRGASRRLSRAGLGPSP